MGKHSLVVTDREPGAPPVDLFNPTSRTIEVTGRRNIEALRHLIEAGQKGVSALDFWATGKRLSHYVFKLRGFGLEIETQDIQAGDGITYGRYILKGDIRIEQEPDREAA